MEVKFYVKDVKHCGFFDNLVEMELDDDEEGTKLDDIEKRFNDAWLDENGWLTLKFNTNTESLSVLRPKKPKK